MSDANGFLRQIALVLSGQRPQDVAAKVRSERMVGFVPRGTTEKVTLNRSKCNGTRN